MENLPFFFKSAWIFACSLQITRNTLGCIFSLFYASFTRKNVCNALLLSLLRQTKLRFLFFSFEQEISKICHRENLGFCLRFFLNRSVKQEKKMQPNVFLVICRLHAKIQALLKKVDFPLSIHVHCSPYYFTCIPKFFHSSDSHITQLALCTSQLCQLPTRQDKFYNNCQNSHALIGS